MVVNRVFDSVQRLQGLLVLALQNLWGASGDTARQKSFVVVVKYAVRKELTLADGHDSGRGYIAG
jgi:hypothetical protein